MYMIARAGRKDSGFKSKIRNFFICSHSYYENISCFRRGVKLLAPGICIYYNGKIGTSRYGDWQLITDKGEKT
ncbi:hypothetical protein K420107F6_12120 [Lactonifactor longoviformis]